MLEVRRAGADDRAVPWLCMVLALAVLSNPSRAEAGEHYLAVQRFTERGANAKGDGEILSGALEYELTATGAFEALADRASKKAMKKIIAKQNKYQTDEKYWVELGHEVGASHLLRGEVWEKPRACFARVKLITLKTGKAKVSSPEAYDCTAPDLKALAGELSVQLIGKRASPPQHRKRPIEKVEPPVEITMVGNERIDAEPDRDESGSAELPPTPPPPVAPDWEWMPKPKPDPRSVVDTKRWPGLAPHPDGDLTYTLFDVAFDLHGRAPLVAGFILLIPVVLIFVGAIAVRIRREAAVFIVTSGFSLSLLILAMTLTAVGFYSYGLQRPVMEDVETLLLAAPVLAIPIWLVGGRMLVTYGEMKLGRRILSVFLFTAFFSVLVLIASQVHVSIWLLGIATVVFFAVMRFAGQARRRKKDLREAVAS